MAKAKKVRPRSFKKTKLKTTPKQKFTFKKALRHPIQWFKSLDRKQKILVIAIAAVIVFFLFTGGLFAYYSRDLPDPNKINSSLAQSSMIYDRDGKLLYEVHGDQRRTLIGFDEMPDTIKWATVAIEDVDFYKHHGIDFRGIARAAFSNIFKHRGTQGGSTITQQFVKNALLTPERTYGRKIKEVILAIEIEQKYSKDEILKMYLNEIPYGANAYGVQAAAETYFGKDAKDLKLEECALLAAITKAPTYYSPYGSHTDEMKDRQEIVLDYMAEQDYIDQKTADKAKKKKLTFAKYHENIKAPHFVMYVKEVLAQEYGERMVEEGGLKVTTTLNWNKQKIAETAVEEGVARNRGRYNAGNASLVSIDPKTGQILAMVGSYDYFDLENDGNVNVALRDRQPGSSFKPYAYATAFKKGFTPETNLFDLRTDFGGGYTPQNYDSSYRGPVQMKNALAMSLNIPAVKTLYLAGVDKTINTARSMGIGTLGDPDHYGLALVLGGGEVKLLEHTAAFSAFATNGKKHEKTAILKVEDNEGKVLEEYKDEKGEQVLDENVAKTINEILSTDSLRAPVFGSGSGLTLGDRPVAAKTGTTNEFRDAWTMGYTPNLACGVWVGNNDNAAMTSGAAGFVAATPIWNQYMREAVKDLPKDSFNRPQEMTANKAVLRGKTDKEGEKLKVCTISGKKATKYCPPAYVKEKSYSLNHCILYYVNKDDPLGDPPADPKADFQFERWEKPVSGWAKDKGLGSSAPTDNCNVHRPEYAPSISITSPTSGQTFYNGSLVTINVTASASKGMRKVSFYFDGTLLGSDSSSPYSYAGSIPIAVGAGGHTIKIKAYDRYYNENSASVSITVNHDSNDPVCTLLTPPNAVGLLPGMFPYAVTANATDAESGMEKVEFYINGSLSGTDYTADAGDIYIYTWIYPGAGAYAVYAKAYDRAGNTKDSATSNVNVF